jgi:hypothetical protein
MWRTVLIAFFLGFASTFGLGVMRGAGLVAQPSAVTEAKQAAAQAQPKFGAEALPQDGCEPDKHENYQGLLERFENVFPPAQWTLTTDLENDTASWVSYPHGAIAYMQYLYYDCGAGVEQLEEFFSPGTLEILLANYVPYRKIAQCRSSGLWLYEFDGILNETNYHTRYWAWLAAPTRLAALHLVFPFGEDAKLDAYAERLFPQLPRCPHSH